MKIYSKGLDDNSDVCRVWAISLRHTETVFGSLMSQADT